MAKGKINIFCGVLMTLLLTTGGQSHAQIEVVPLEDEEVKAYYYDSIPAHAPFTMEERKIPDSILDALKSDEAFWYANAAPVQEKKSTEKDASSLQWLREKWVRVLLWIIILGSFVAVLAWYLSTLNIRLFRRPSAALSTLPDVSLAEDIFTIHFADEIAKAVQEGDYRQAIRLYYLQTLRLLSEKELIRYKQDVTNSEYVAQLYRTNFYKDFFRLTRNFEYTWYGGFAIAPAAFDAMQKDFITFQNKVAS